MAIMASNMDVGTLLLEYYKNLKCLRCEHYTIDDWKQVRTGLIQYVRRVGTGAI